MLPFGMDETRPLLAALLLALAFAVASPSGSIAAEALPFTSDVMRAYEALNGIAEKLEMSRKGVEKLTPPGLALNGSETYVVDPALLSKLDATRRRLVSHGVPALDARRPIFTKDYMTLDGEARRRLIGTAQEDLTALAKSLDELKDVKAKLGDFRDLADRTSTWSSKVVEWAESDVVQIPLSVMTETTANPAKQLALDLSEEIIPRLDNLRDLADRQIKDTATRQGEAEVAISLQRNLVDGMKAIDAGVRADPKQAVSNPGQRQAADREMLTVRADMDRREEQWQREAADRGGHLRSSANNLLRQTAPLTGEPSAPPSGTTGAPGEAGSEGRSGGSGSGDGKGSLCKAADGCSVYEGSNK
jgi:hypothetical protein